MDNKDIMLTELRQISPLIAEIENVNIYSVPAFYFDNLPQNILQNINSANEPLKQVSPITPYKVEERYFDNLPENILQKIRNDKKKSTEIIDELKDIAPSINTISKSPVFSVPNGYFQNFNVSPERSIRPRTRLFVTSKQVTRYAVAAVITALMAVGVYLTIGKVDRRSREQAVNVKSAVQSLRNEEIIEFLRMHAPRNKTGNVSSQKKSAAFKYYESLKQMTDEEIQQYLQENLETGEIEADI
ncbi:MAG TPA: hypothetical protein VM888_13675 [Chitinophagaceae bacterium]|nr:hypothetical protein [Chitinophagaceae bacterium]